MISCKYKTERECTELFVHDSFANIPAWLITEREDFYDAWEFYGIDDETDEYTYVGRPMWDTWFMSTDSWDDQWHEDHAEEIAREAGFTIIYHEGEIFGFGIDGAGYDFYESHWIPLYRLHGFTWHDEEENDD